MNVIMSINPQYVEKIFEGTKQYEYRKSIFKRDDINRVYIYATYPICKIVGYFTIDNILCDTPVSVWEKTSEHGGITKQFYDEYYRGYKKAYAIGIKDVKQYDECIEPKTIIDNFRPPQNFIYADVELD